MLDQSAHRSQVVARVRVGGCSSEEVIGAIWSFGAICISPHQATVFSAGDLREHVSEVHPAANTGGYFIEFGASHVCTLVGECEGGRYLL